MPKPRPPFLHREVNRHGTVCWYVRREHGSRIRLREEYNSQAFWAEYQAAVAGTPQLGKSATPRKNSLSWAIERYRQSSAWKGLATATRRQRENIFRSVLANDAGDYLLKEIDTATIRDGRERRSSTPHAANNFLKAMRGLFAWAVDAEIVAANPTKGVSLLKGSNDDQGFHTWTEEELQRFEARWPLGTRERLAFDVLLYTGLRRGDAVILGRQHVRNGAIFIRTEKNDAEIALPVLAPLAASIAATKTGDLAFLVTERGRPFVKESFGNWFREVCGKAGCPGSAHGLRKAGATRAAENGATERQLMALFGWSDPKMAAHYTRAASRKRLAADAARLLLPAQTENEKRPHLGSGEGVTPISPDKTGT